MKNNQAIIIGVLIGCIIIAIISYAIYYYKIVPQLITDNAKKQIDISINSNTNINTSSQPTAIHEDVNLEVKIESNQAAHIKINLVNNSSRTIYYKKGCAVQYNIYKIVNNERQEQKMSNAACLAVPEIKKLSAGDKVQIDIENIQTKFYSGGDYQISYPYSFIKDFKPQDELTTFSQTFTIAGEDMPDIVNQMF